jgi:16S rRNA (guanine966-N2)-methyltransferase
MRERCFGILGDRVIGARVLDLYGGTGAVGLEALSRGAASVVFVESHRSASALIRHNLATLEVDPNRGRLLLRPTERAVTELVRSGEIFDLVWADPPFDRWQDGFAVLTDAIRGGLLADRGVACLECPAEARIEAFAPENLEITRDVKGGASRVVMMQRNG